MACFNPDVDKEAARERIERMRALTIALCLACKTLVESDKLPEQLRDWYRAHTASDRARRVLNEDRQNVYNLQKKLSKDGLAMSHDHKLIVRRDAASDAAQIAYATERKETLKLLSLVKEHANE